jgi:succinate dehydrogenase / fumarate reductase, cytochrome b subunit
MPSHIRRVFSSSIGTKLLIGLTGLALFVYLVTHLAGNVIIFFGRDAFNRYAYLLGSNPLIIVIEIGLLLVFVLHIYKTVMMWRANQAARPVRYAKKELANHTSRKGLASSTMIFSGLLTALFVVIHVKQFRFGTHYLVEGSDAVRDLYRTEIEVFSNPLWVAFYVICTLVVGLHLRHGIASSVQSLGLEHPRYTRRILLWGLVLAIVIAGGLAVIPVWVYLTK